MRLVTRGSNAINVTAVTAAAAVGNCDVKVHDCGDSGTSDLTVTCVRFNRVTKVKKKGSNRVLQAYVLQENSLHRQTLK